LEAARKKGKQLGRPKGPGKSKLDEYREVIISDLRGGVTKAHIAKKHNVTPATLHNWLKRHKLNKIKPILS
jgi:transposase-like protein